MQGRPGPPETLQAARPTDAPAPARDGVHLAHRVLESLQDGVVLLDHSLTLTYMNPASARFIGRQPQDVLGRHVWDVFPGAQDSEFGRAVVATMADGIERHVESTTADIPGKWFEASYVRVPDGVAGIFRDVTERHAAQASLKREHVELERVVQERTAGLEALNRELDAFNYSVSHDLRSHLRGISAFCGLLRERHGARLPPDGLQIVDRVTASCNDLAHIVDGLLRLTQLNRAPLHHTVVDVSGLARRHLERLARDSPQRKVTWTVQDRIQAWADKDQIDIVVGNLLSNAWKFTAPVPDARIAVERTPDGFRVRDNGAGFNMANASRLFEPFFRLHTDREFEGHGIGLATVARILHRHGGAITADSQVGAGTTMAIRIQAPSLTVPA